MAVGLSAPGVLHPVKGVRLAAAHCGLKADAGVKDLTLLALDADARVAGVFTQSHFCAAPVTVCRQHLRETPQSRFLLINSGNANAATGDQGLQDALDCCAEVAAMAGVEVNRVLPFSTGVIAEPLNTKAIRKAIPDLFERLRDDAWLDAAEGIMTTDTLPKAASVQLEIDGHCVSISGMAKGSGMIKPNMATMLAYVATDAEIEASELQQMLRQAVAGSFNSISVDGDTSTNDACMLIATGRSGLRVRSANTEFVEALNGLFRQLAQAIIRDAEGATKFVEVRVRGAVDDDDARSVAFTIAESPLVKTALFASDPNWGRLIMAIGRAPVSRIDTGCVDVWLGSVRLLHQGLPDPDYSEAAGQAEMSKQEITINVDLGLGAGDARIWTSDLSYDYVKINAEYRS